MRYLTKLRTSTRVFSDETSESVRLIHDFLLHAAEEQLDISMVCGTLRSSVRDNLFRQFTGDISFAEGLKAVLESGASVRILMWTNLEGGIVAPSIVTLLEEYSPTARSKATVGSLQLRSSGTTEGWENLGHFMVAHRNDRWMLRIEQPHKPTTNTKQKLNGTLTSPTIVTCGDDAKLSGPKFLQIFDRLFAAAGKTKRRMTLA